MKATLTFLAFAGLGAGAWHFAGWRKSRRPPRPPTDNDIRQAVARGVPGTVDVRVREGVVALRGTASAAERDRALTHALSVPGVRRVYSDLETGAGSLQTQAGKSGIAHPRA